MNIFRKIINRIHSHRLSVVLDPRDNSVTFDPPLVRHMDIMSQSQAFIYTFRVMHWHRNSLLDIIRKRKLRSFREYYAFALNPPTIDPDTDYVAQVQIDDSTGDIGYECLCPGLSRIAYDLGLPTTCRSRLSVKPQNSKLKTQNSKLADNFTYYRIVPPHHYHADKLPSSLHDDILHSEFSQSLIHEANKERIEEMNRLRDEVHERMKQDKTQNNH